jgi:hypothetical protein
MTTIGVVANPASGKDVRRLVARASVFDNPEKQAIVIRALAGAASVLAGTPWRVAYLNDRHGIVRQAVSTLFGKGDTCAPELFAVADAPTVSALDTTRAARALAGLPSAVNITLGGDGTNRAFARGWTDAPLVPVSTGTNNVFPQLVANGAVSLAEVARQRKLIRVEIEGEADDLALIDAVLLDDRFVGSRAILSPEQLRAALLTIADPGAVGMTAIGGLLEPLDADDDRGLGLELGGHRPDGVRVCAPIAPGYYQEVQVGGRSHVGFGQKLVWHGPGVLAFDGERERVLRAGQRAVLWVERTGPHVVDVAHTMRRAAERGVFRRDASAGAAAGVERSR